MTTYTATEAATELRVSTSTITRRIKSGIIDAEKEDGVWIISKDAIEREKRTTPYGGRLRAPKINKKP